MFDDGGFGRQKKKEEADLDITPMIDVTFLLLIFFMVTSTMQGTPDKDIPPSLSGDNATKAGVTEVSVLAPASSAEEGEIILKDKTVSLDQLKTDLIQEGSVAEQLKLMIYVERDVKSGFVGEVEKVIGEVAGEVGKEIPMYFAVRDRK